MLDVLPGFGPVFVLPASFEARRRFKRGVRIDVDEKGIARADGDAQKRLRWMDINRFVSARGDVLAFTDGAGGQLGIPEGIEQTRLLLDIVQERLADAHAWRVRRFVHGPTAEVPFYQPRKVALVLLGTALAIAVVLAWISLLYYVQVLISFISGMIYVATLPTSIVVGPQRVTIRSRLRSTRLDTSAIRGMDLLLLEDRGATVVLRLANGETFELRGFGAATLSLYDRLRQVTQSATESSAAGIHRQFDPRRAAAFIAASALLVLLLVALPVLNGRAVSEGARFLPPAVISGLIDLGTPINTSDREGRTATYNAAKFGRVEMLRVLVAKGADPSMRMSRSPGFTALHVAAEYNQLEVVDLLLTAGVSPDVVNDWGQTPLMQLANLGHREPQEQTIADTLIRAGANLNVKDQDGFTVAHLADEPEVTWLIALLGKYGADLNLPNRHGERPLDRAMLDDKPFFVRALAEAGANLEVNRRDSEHPWLFEMVLAKNNEKIKLLLECGARTDVVDDVGWTPLSAAAKTGNLEGVRLLLDAGAGVNLITDGVGSALRIALLEKAPEIARLLLDRGASPNSTFRGVSALQLAVQDGQNEVAAQLIERGAIVNFATQESASPLFLAAFNDNIALIELLLKAGADPNLAFREQYTPLRAAQRVRSQKAIDILVAAGAR